MLLSSDGDVKCFSYLFIMLVFFAGVSFPVPGLEQLVKQSLNSLVSSGSIDSE